MAVYDEVAHEKCRALYIKFGGKNLDAIEREMQKEYPGWRKSYLFDRGREKNFKEGWINKFGYDKSLEIATQLKTESVLNDTQKLYLNLKKVREKYQSKALATNATRDDSYLYRDFVKLELDALKALDLSRANFETFVAAWELLCEWLPNMVSTNALKELIGASEKLLEKARLEYGESEGSEQPSDG